MSSPSFENIDQWLFEYIEGILSPAQEEQLLEFIQEYPELLQELKNWKQSKVTATEETMSIQGLLKKPSLVQQPLFYLSITIFTLFLIWGAWTIQQPIAQQYSAKEIDTGIIKIARVEASNTALSTANSENSTTTLGGISLATIKTEENTTPLQKEKEAQSTTIAFSSIENSGHAESQPISYNTSFTPNSQHVTTPVTNIIEEFKINKDVSELDLSLSSNSPGAKNLIKAEDLEEVILSLNDNSKTNNSSLESEQNTAQLKEVSVKTATKSSVSTMLRKIKRMIDQPTALRNTRNPYFHTPMMTGYRTNPGMVGSNFGNRIQATSRIQWMGKENSQLMNTLSWDGYFYALRGGVGVDINYDGYQNGAINNYSVGLVYSPKFSITKYISFEPALTFKMGVVDLQNPTSLIGENLEINRNNLTPFFINNQELTGDKLWYRDVGLGFMVNTKSFYFGFNADNIGQHNNNFYSSDLNQKYYEKVHYTAIIGTEYQSLMRDISVNGYGLFQSYGSLTEFWLGGNFQYKWAEIGAGVNTRADFSVSAGASINRVTLHYNIDYIKSRLLKGKYLSHQITMKVLLKPSRQAAKFLQF